jgi:transposase InsO family protein
MRTDFVLDALEQALYDRQPERSDALIHHSHRGSQYVSIRCRLCRISARHSLGTAAGRPIEGGSAGSTALNLAMAA